jgi:hypothetical protein
MEEQTVQAASAPGDALQGVQRAQSWKNVKVWLAA